MCVALTGLSIFIGCTVGRTLALRDSDAIARRGEPPPVFPSDGVEVRVEVVHVSHPLVDSPSIGADRSTATLKVLSGSVPAAPEAVRIELAFDHHGPLGMSGKVEAGRTLDLRFTADGRLFDIN